MFLESGAYFDNPYADIDYEVDAKVAKDVSLIVSDVAATVLGWAAAFIVFGMGVITALDVFYIAWPAFQAFVRSKQLDQHNTEVGKKFTLVSRDAVDSVVEAQASGGSSMGIYLGKRIKTYIVTILILVGIVLGSDFIVKIVAKMLSGIYRWLFG